jgi:arylsulfatase
MADDLGWADLSCYGQKWFETPRINAMAREGMRFTHRSRCRRGRSRCPVS